MKSHHRSGLPMSYTFDKDLQNRIKKTIGGTSNIDSQSRRQASQDTGVHSGPGQSNFQGSQLPQLENASSTYLFPSGSLPRSARKYNHFESQVIRLPQEEKYQHNFIRQVRHPTPNLEKSRYRSRQSVLVHPAMRRLASNRHSYDLQGHRNVVTLKPLHMNDPAADTSGDEGLKTPGERGRLGQFNAKYRQSTDLAPALTVMQQQRHRQQRAQLAHGVRQRNVEVRNRLHKLKQMVETELETKERVETEQRKVGMSEDSNGMPSESGLLSGEHRASSGAHASVNKSTDRSQSRFERDK